MVYFTSIKKGIFVISMALIGTSHAAPATSDGPSKTLHSDTNFHNFALPPLISNRTQAVVPHSKTISLNSETENMLENIEWFQELGINYTGMVQRGDIKTLDKMILDLPANIRAASEQNLQNRLNVNFGDEIVIASPGQIDNHKYYAALAATAYCREVTGLGLWTCENCQKYVPDGQVIFKFNSPIADTTGFILKSDSQKTINLVFRGTNSLRQTITDLILIKKDYPPVDGTQVHTGFYNSYLEVADQFFPYIQREIAAHPNYKIVVSGHSLGAAHALFAALDLYQRDRRFDASNLSVYTVGSPRIGDTNFAYYVKGTGIPYYRSVNDRDVIPHFPAQGLGYLHAGIEIWDLPGYGSHVCTSETESAYCSNSIVPATHILDHLTYYGINEGLCL
ncbi:hypothetical protein INT47_000614 [Mucor saturninus]|uniref:Fungal lipase-type domain-containing protein n=1 Tax=Mucor saturninus TaxID=64648 RepID=A0A8H7RN27_9FUNG|nr:hypothetical protein INT47_000614 [Mucor saturninus]